MALLEALKLRALETVVLLGPAATVVDAKRRGSAVVELTYKDAAGTPGSPLLHRHKESGLRMIQPDRVSAFDGDGYYRCRRDHCADRRGVVTVGR